MGSWLSAAVVEDEEEEVELVRPVLPPMKMKLGTYAMYRVFTGLGPLGEKLGCAYVGLHFALYAVRVLSLAPVPGRDLVWPPPPLRPPVHLLHRHRTRRLRLHPPLHGRRRGLRRGVRSADGGASSREGGGAAPASPAGDGHVLGLAP
ncbi:hypothetical protein HU200_029052 [Digitaria exilis]|uniref:Uncharacterized protein n=1 Tax=Digitaria exilis TaxID=1010633 RepID=A0A835ESA7_9POAL|nr:hypothetical protein HU200_029052 [Digitaria exilis]